MKTLIEFLQTIRFDMASIGIQKDLLLASLIGVILNLPKTIKSNFYLAIHIISSTLLSTILTPLIMVLIEHLFTVELNPSTGYGIAALVGIVGINSIKKIIIDKLSSKTKDDDTTNPK